MSSEATAVSSGELANLLDVDSPTRASQIENVPSTSIARTSLIHESSNEILLALIRNGDKEALSVLFKQHARAVYNVARRILRDDSEAEDLLQDLFLFVSQKARLFDASKGSASSWIIQMAYHRAIDRRRYLSSRRHYENHALEEDRLGALQGQLSINAVAGRELLTKLREELSSEQSQTLELHFFEGYSFHEIAKKTGQTFGNVRNHYYRGIERLRTHIFRGKKDRK